MPRNNYIKPTMKNLKSAAKSVAKIPGGLVRKVFTNANITDAFPDMRKKRRK